VPTVDTETVDLQTVIAAAEKAIKARNRYRRSYRPDDMKQYEALLRELDKIVNPPIVSKKKGVK
jgi:hypothetical protein